MNTSPHNPPKRSAPSLLRVFRNGWLANFLWICLAAVPLLALFLHIKTSSKIAMSYQGQTNMAGQYVAFFVITNVSDVTTTTYHTGNIELADSNDTERVSCETGQPALRPGDTDTVKVFLPAAIHGRWRFTIGYARAGAETAKNYLTSEWIN